MFDFSTASIVISVFLSATGIGYCAYGKKNSPYFLVAGVLLLLITFFVDNPWWMGGLGFLCIVVPFFLDPL